MKSLHKIIIKYTVINKNVTNWCIYLKNQGKECLSNYKQCTQLISSEINLKVKEKKLTQP